MNNTTKKLLSEIKRLIAEEVDRRVDEKMSSLKRELTKEEAFTKQRKQQPTQNQKTKPRLNFDMRWDEPLNSNQLSPIDNLLAETARTMKPSEYTEDPSDPTTEFVKDYSTVLGEWVFMDDDRR